MIMKKVMYFLAILIAFSPLSLDAQVPTQINNTSGPGTGNGTKPTLDENCDYTLNFKVFVTNLDLLNGVDCVNGQELSMPPNDPDRPPMVLEMIMDGVKDTVTVDKFLLQSCVGFYDEGIAVYSFQHAMTLSFNNECNNGEGEFDLDWSMKIMTLGPNGLELIDYPMCVNAAPGGLFDCYFFYETSHLCPHDPLPGGGFGPNCSDDVLNYFSGNFPIQCPKGGCEYLPNPNESPKGGINDPWRSSGNSPNEIETASLALEVSPNPFHSSLNIRLTNATDNPQVRLYSTNGKLIKSWQQSNYKDRMSLEFDTADLPNGMYILHIQSGGKSIHKKLIKH